MKPFFEMDHDANRYNSIAYDPGTAARLNRLYGGTTVGDDWTPVSLEWSSSERETPDLPKCSMAPHCPVFSRRAWKALEPLIGEVTEALPVECPGDTEYVLVNVFEVIDCMDRRRARFTYYPSRGVRRVVRFAFRDPLVKRKHIFRVPESPSTVVVSKEFKDRAEEAGLTGADFGLLPGMETSKKKAKKPAPSRRSGQAGTAKTKKARPKRATAKGPRKKR